MVEKQCKKKAKGQSQPPKTPSESRQDQPKTKKVMMFPYQQQEAPLRTLSETLQHAKLAVDTKNSYMGVHRPSVLSTIVDYDYIAGTSIDYMHGGCSGVGRGHITLWFDPQHNTKPWSLRSELEDIDEDLKRIQPPTALARKARSLDDRKFWKASEFRSWVLYYSVPLLFGRMKQPYFTHWCCFVMGLYILLQPSISKENLGLAEILFRFFYQEHSKLYGMENAVMNVHNVTHYTKTVKDSGPLWTNNCFLYENENGKLSSQVHGTYQIVLGVVRRFFLKKNIRFLNFSPSEKVRKFLTSMGLDLEKPTECGSKTIEVVGKPFSISLLGSEKKACTEPPKQAYGRANIRGIIYTSIAYTRLIKRTDSYVAYRYKGSVDFGQVKYFYQTQSGEVMALILYYPSACDWPVILKALRIMNSNYYSL
jgi:hypothetical protein